MGEPRELSQEEVRLVFNHHNKSIIKSPFVLWILWHLSSPWRPVGENQSHVTTRMWKEKVSTLSGESSDEGKVPGF